jgi:hypothetical protein
MEGYFGLVKKTAREGYFGLIKREVMKLGVQ